MTDLDKMAHEIAQAHERFGDWGYEDMVDAIRTALLTAPPGDVLVPVEALRRWQAAFAEEMAAHDISPPIKHVKDGHDEIAAMIAAAPEPEA